MLKRQRTGSVVCTSCGSLVGVNDERCYTCGRRNPGLWGFALAVRSLGTDLGFVTFVLGSCIVLYVISLIMSGPGAGMMGFMSFLAPNLQSLMFFGASGAYPVFGLGRWWTVASASWLHGSFLHILFNMMWVRQLGPAAADVYGAARMVIIYVVSGICGFVLSSAAGYLIPPIPFLRGAQVTMGASASIFGLLGAMVYYGRRGGSSLIRREAVGYAVPLFLFGVFMPNIDNYAHAGGFAGGYLAARWLDPLRPERIDHVVIALICLGLSALAVLASVLVSLRILS